MIDRSVPLANPWPASIWQTSSPERTRSLPNRDLQLGHVDLVGEASDNFIRRSRLEKKLECLLKIGACFLDCVALAAHIELGAECHEAAVFRVNDRSHISGHAVSPRLEELLIVGRPKWPLAMISRHGHRCQGMPLSEHCTGTALRPSHSAGVAAHGRGPWRSAPPDRGTFWRGRTPRGWGASR